MINMFFKCANTNSNMLVFDEIYPIGQLYFSMSSANPSTYLGGGTWTQVAKGQTIVNINPDDSDFNTAGKTGGDKEQTLIAMFGAFNSTTTAIAYCTTSRWNNVTYRYGGTCNGVTNNVPHNGINHNTLVVRSTGERNTPTVQPYITTYIWKRTA